jgi:ABC-2 type transport system permease protein
MIVKMSIRRLLAMAYKEALQIWRDPRSLAIALLLPLLQMLLLGYGVSLDIKHVPLCIFDQERSQLSRALVERFVASGWFSTVRDLDNERAIRTALDRGSCIGAVTIPVNFSRVFTTTGRAAVQTAFDATDVNTTNIATGYAQGVIAQTTADFETRWASMHGVQPPTIGTIDYEPRVWFNEGLDSRNFIIPGVVAVILALIGAQLTSLTISREWERGTMERLISTPVTGLEMMFGKLIPYFVVGLFDAAFCLLTTIFWFEVPFRGDLATLLVATALFTLVVLGIGYAISAWIRSQLGASQVALLLTMTPVSMLSGYTFPIDQMPAPIRGVTFVVHARYYVTILRAVFLKGSGITDLLLPISALVLYACVVVLMATRAFHKRLD